MRRAGQRGCPPRWSYLPLVFLIIVLSFVCVKLAEDNRKLREELSKWEALKLHTVPPSKPRFYHAGR